MNECHAAQKGYATTVRRDRDARIDEFECLPMEYPGSLETRYRAVLVEEMRQKVKA